MHQYITVMKEHEFVLWVIGAHACDRGKFVYELPDNVVEVHEVFLDDALKLKEHGNQNGQLHRINHFSEEETKSLRELMECSHPDWEVLFHLYHDRKMNPMSFLKSEQFLNILTESCLEKYPYIAFADAFHTMRSMLLPVLYLLGSEVPQADTYHAISTGYGGLLACLGGYVYRRPVLLTEHGIYTREREEEIIRAKWVIPSFKKQWISFFYMLSEAIYKRAFRVTSLFTNAMLTQIQIGCDAEKCRVIENGIDYDRLSQIPLKEEDGWIDIGAVVRLAPIKDIKTMIYAFYELSSRMENVRLHILGGVDDEEYADECYALVKQLDIKNLVFTGRVDIVQYMRKLDFTILTSISEGQPLSVLESFAARRPCVTTDVGCCRELLNGKEGDNFGCAGYCVPPMYRDGLAFAMEKMCESRRRRIRMGKSGQARTKAYYRHERMISEYRKLYREVEDLPKVDLSRVHATDGVVVEGFDNTPIKFAKCCSPLPGDPIVGFITRGFGVSIHKQSCANAVSSMKDPSNAPRWVKAYWADSVKDSYKAGLEIIALNRNELLSDVLAALADIRVPIYAMNARQVENNCAVISLTIGINNTEHLNRVVARLSKVKDVLKVTRS